jgi:hypothetical protein
MTLRARILLLLCAVAIGLVAATLVTVEAITRRQSARTLRHDLERTRLLFEGTQELRLQKLISETRLTKDIPFLKALVSSGDQATVLSFVKDLRGRIGSDLLAIADESGGVLGSTDDGVPRNLGAASPAVASAFKGEARAGLLAGGDRLYRTYAAPIGLGESI